MGIPARQAGWPQAVTQGARDLLAWGAGLALVGLPLLVCNTALYGGPLHTGYSTGRLINLVRDQATFWGMAR